MDLPAAFRPMTAIFSPRVTSAVSGWITSLPWKRFSRSRISSVCLPLGAFTSNLMKGAWMLERFRSSSLSFWIWALRLCTCEARVPAEKRATNSWSCSIFFFFSAFSDSMRFRTCPFCRTMSS